MKSIGLWGESFVAEWLQAQGLTVVGSNVMVPGGEIDLLAKDGSQRVVVEVRTITGRGDPLDAADRAKRRHVRGLAHTARVDFVGVGVRSFGIEVHWLPG